MPEQKSINSTDAANEAFKKVSGRDLDPQEKAWVDSAAGYWNSKQYGSGAIGAASEYAAALNKTRGWVEAEAKAYGLKNFDPTQADALIQDMYDPSAGTFDESKDRFRARLETLKTEQLQNPYKFASGNEQTKFQSDAARIIKTTLGRDASPDELDFYAGKLAEGEKPYELAQFLQQSPEFQESKAAKENERVKAESDAARGALDQQLLKSEEETFKRSLPTILSSYMKSGRINSSGVDSAIAKERADLASKRQDYIAGLGYQDAVRAQGYNRENFVGGQNQAFQKYLRDSEPYSQRTSALTQLGYTLPFQQAQDRVGRSREVEDYYRQMNDYNRYLSDSRKQSREAAMYGLAGNVIGAGVSAATYGAMR